MSTTKNDKYFVCKIDDLDDTFKALGDTVDRDIMSRFRKGLEDIELGGAEVIRHQDITAAPIFHHYASSIMTIVELADKFNTPIDKRGLTAIADHFHEAAEAAERVEHKLPD